MRFGEKQLHFTAIYNNTARLDNRPYGEVGRWEVYVLGSEGDGRLKYVRVGRNATPGYTTIFAGHVLDLLYCDRAIQSNIFTKNDRMYVLDVNQIAQLSLNIRDSFSGNTGTPTYSIYRDSYIYIYIYIRIANH